MKTIKHLVFSALIATVLLVPSQTRAGEREDNNGNNENNGNHGNKDKHKDKQDDDNKNNDIDKSNKGGDYASEGNTAPSAPVNSVPVNGGLVVLFAAGLGLGVKIILDKNKKKEINSSSI